MAYESQVEREYLIRKLGAGFGPQTPLQSLRRAYYIKIAGPTGSNVGFATLQMAWLIAEIAARGGTAIARSMDTDLWKQLVTTIGQTPSKYTTQNKLIFFSTAS